MNSGYALLAGRIRLELAELQRVVQRINKARDAMRQHPQDQDFYIDSATLNMHGFYESIGKLFEQIAKTVEKSLPSGQSWHRDLLQQMNTPVPGIRPAVISAESQQKLDEFLRFRHVVRNVYTFQLDPQRVGELSDLVDPCFDLVQKELLAFADLVEQLAHPPTS